MGQDDGEAPFWETRSLDVMTDAQWESLCDGCGKCCLHRLQGDDGGLIETRVACKLLDTETCRCSNYPRRFELVKDCVSLRLQRIESMWWLPESCAYRRVGEGRALAWWHPLVSGDPETVHTSGASVRGQVISEAHVDMASLELYIKEEGG